MNNYKRVLAIGAHADDIELGCGAFLSRLERDGVELRVIAFSRAEQSLADDMPVDTLELEFRASMALLDLDESSVHAGRIPVRHFPEHRQEVLEELVRINREMQPDLILTMNSKDTHQDHEVIHNETVRAFRGSTVLGYEIPWNQQQNVINLFAEVTEEDVQRKIEMLASYKSQATLGRTYMSGEFVRAAALYHGYQARKQFAEAFEVITMMWESE